MDADAFRAYVVHVLAPELAPGNVVVMDSLATHEVAGIAEAIEAAGGSLLYLPPYSPDFIPIEKAFAKLKALLRNATARTVTDLWSAIAAALNAFSPQECRNLFAACGYDCETPARSRSPVMRGEVRRGQMGPDSPVAEAVRPGKGGGRTASQRSPD